ncbi:stalk domain-containing protein [Thermicanus aegyptius]|uniref:stalk domain-containing protein n=1 Tax=Thermicanus aegyptius TaxID=94009 RepID=UPI00041A66C7|nr:stalk domain-containing protein [Thermicanus aegyptius]
MRRFIVFFSIFILFAAWFAQTDHAEPSQNMIRVYVDGNEIAFDVSPKVVNGRTLVPLRRIFEALDSEITWDGATQTVTAVKEDTKVVLTVGKTKAKKGDKEFTLDVAPTITNGRTLVPLRFVGEALGATVGWDGTSKVVTIDSAPKKEVKVLEVVDGDTIKVDWDGKEETIRFIGVDTPETVHPTIGVEEYGKEASDYTKSKLNGQMVLIAKDIEERDKYGRLLGYVFLANGTFFNGDLVSNGYANVSTFPPNVKWVKLFTFLESEARKANRGLWGSEKKSPDATNKGDTGKVIIESLDLNDEIVIIKNSDTKDINMTGWKLVSTEGNQTFQFPDGFVLKKGASVKIVSGKNAAPRNGVLVWTKAFIWNNEGDKAELYDSSGKLVSQAGKN